ncbi:transmembrane protein 59-like [Babylonia areolata]|uniref:transmembrane protein 59-like n=1 Tax=Babylonia areolata TaxID=304850 RepID=UPI003FD28A42
MAALSNLLFVTFACGLVCATAGLFDQVLNGADSCYDICDKTYAAHTYENSNESGSCKRGCRFCSIMAFFHDYAENETLADCTDSCREAYNGTNGISINEADACVSGCRSQLQNLEPKGGALLPQDEERVEDARMHMLYPLMYMHSVYSNMLDKVYRHMEFSWSVFKQGDSGQIVVVRSQPVIVNFVPEDVDLEDIPDETPWPDDRTSSFVETNIAGQDNSATPFFSFAFGPSQLRSARSMGDSHDLQLDAESDRSDWLSCVARKTGIARIVLCFLILATAVVMIWFCLTAAATAPEQHLSINGDLEYLRTMDEKDCYKLLQPQSRVEARPLPIKIKVEQI